MAIFGKKEEEKKETSETSADATKNAGAKTAPDLNLPHLLKQPRISEKAGHLVNLNKYVFNVQKSANKVSIKKAVEEAYKVRVIRVNIINNKGKARNFGRTKGTMSGFKKAIVTLKKGDTISGLTDVI
jgi:large subunit ribosomal protein L23